MKKRFGIAKFYFILILGLVGISAVSVTALAVERPTQPQPQEVWLMSVYICKDFPPNVESAIRRGVIIIPKHLQCRWLAVGQNNPFTKANELAVWSTLEDCQAELIEAPEGFRIKEKRCQRVQ
tara:strand:+ start:1386 stop:1754 length:369 start_codon:yes stop_codon:yes gene_type:complete